VAVQDVSSKRLLEWLLQETVRRALKPDQITVGDQAEFDKMKKEIVRRLERGEKR
jgi:hypothetical protein